MRKNIKNNRFIRGIYFLLKSYISIRRKSFGQIGENVIITPPYNFGNPQNIFIGDNVGIGPYCFISAINAKFIVKGNCAIAERLAVHTGNHAQVIGKFVSDITEINKPKGYDLDIIIEEDVWIGCNVTLLSGITVGRGCIVAAGAVVHKSCPPYSIIGGVPAKVIKFRWSLDDVIKHEKILYNAQERLNIDELKAIYGLYEKK